MFDINVVIKTCEKRVEAGINKRDSMKFSINNGTAGVRRSEGRHVLDKSTDIMTMSHRFSTLHAASKGGRRGARGTGGRRPRARMESAWINGR